MNAANLRPECVVLTTAGSRDEAQRIAHALVDERLAACVNIVAEIQSVYRWEDKVQSSEEWQLVIKTTRASFPALRARVKELHSYELPECILLDIEDGCREYLQWVSDSVGERRKTGTE